MKIGRKRSALLPFNFFESSLQRFGTMGIDVTHPDLFPDVMDCEGLARVSGPDAVQRVLFTGTFDNMLYFTCACRGECDFKKELFNAHSTHSLQAVSWLA